MREAGRQGDPSLSLRMPPLHACAVLMQTTNGQIQAREAGLKIRSMLEQGGNGDYRLFFYTSPYKR